MNIYNLFIRTLFGFICTCKFVYSPMQVIAYYYCIAMLCVQSSTMSDIVYSLQCKSRYKYFDGQNFTCSNELKRKIVFFAKCFENCTAFDALNNDLPCLVWVRPAHLDWLAYKEWRIRNHPALQWLHFLFGTLDWQHLNSGILIWK